MATAPDLDIEKLDATTEADIQRYKAAEGYGAGHHPAGPMLSVPAVAELREQMDLTQEAFARMLRIPVATLRNWEQGRKMPDPAARTLLALVAADPTNALRILGGEDPRDPAAAEEADLSVTFTRFGGVEALEPANLNLTISHARAFA